MTELLDWDVALFRWMNVPRGPIADVLFVAAAWLGEYALVWWALGVLLLVKRGRWDWRLAATIVAAVVLSLAVTNAWKFVWFRERPFEYLEGVRRLGLSWGNSAFPSGHAVSSFAAATAIGQSERKWRLWVYLLAVLVALSRPYCGMHHPLDVAAGVLMGLGVGWLVLWASRHKRGDSKKEPT